MQSFYFEEFSFISVQNRFYTANFLNEMDAFQKYPQWNYLCRKEKQSPRTFYIYQSGFQASVNAFIGRKEGFQ